MTLDDLDSQGSANDADPEDRSVEFVVSLANQHALTPIDETLLITTAKQIVRDAGIPCGELSIAIVDDEQMHRLNRQYLDHDYPTDVLSFPLERREDWLEGEIIVSADTAACEAAEVGWDTNTEILLYVIHGTLHLIGLDDHDPDSRKEMRAAERRYLARAGIPLEDCDRRLPDAPDEDSPYDLGGQSWNPAEETE